MVPCNHHGLALNLSACIVDASMIAVSTVASNFSKSSQAEKEALKHWAYMCTLVAFLILFVHLGCSNHQAFSRHSWRCGPCSVGPCSAGVLNFNGLIDRFVTYKYHLDIHILEQPGDDKIPSSELGSATWRGEEIGASATDQPPQHFATEVRC